MKKALYGIGMVILAWWSALKALLDWIGRGLAMRDGPEWMTQIVHWLAQTPPWMPGLAALALVCFFIYDELKKHPSAAIAASHGVVSPLARTPVDLSGDEFLALREAAGIALEETRDSLLAAFQVGYGSGEEQIVFGYFSAMLEHQTPIYGRTPPAQDWVRLQNVDLSDETLWEMKSIKPHHRPVRITDLSVRRSDLNAFINEVLKESGIAANPTYLTSYQVAHYIAHESAWGSHEESERTRQGEMSVEGMKTNVLLAAPEEFRKKAEAGLISAYGSRGLSLQELIDKTHWMTHGLNPIACLNPTENEETVGINPQSVYLRGYSNIKILAADVYRAWPKS